MYCAEGVWQIAGRLIRGESVETPRPRAGDPRGNKGYTCIKLQ